MQGGRGRHDWDSSGGGQNWEGLRGGYGANDGNDDDDISDQDTAGVDDIGRPDPRQWPLEGFQQAAAFGHLTDFTEGNGATRFVPKSHKMDRSAPVNAELAVRAQMKAGSVALWLGATLHGASSSLGTEETEDPRKGLLFIYNQGWLKSEHNFHFAIPPEVQKGFHPTLRCAHTL